MKKLNINAAVCDARKVQEETLANFESIDINGALFITSPNARAMMSRHNVRINCSKSIDLDDETTLNTINGKTTFTGRNTPNGRQYLLINGTMTITPDAGDALRQYMGMTINGTVYCPDFLATVLASKASINGKLYTYPEGAVILKNNAVLDKSFALRAEPRLYWAAKRLVAVDSELDGDELASKGVRFMVPEAYVSETLAESLAPLFDADTRMVVLPDGTSVVQDDLTLSAAGLRRYGDSLVVLGDLYLTPDCAEALSDLEYLQVEGDVYLPEEMADTLDAIPETVLDGEVFYLPGKPLFDKIKMTVDKNLLEAFPEGLTLVACPRVTLTDDLTPADVLEHLSLFNCGSIFCKSALESAVQAVATGSFHVITDDEEDEEDSDPDTMSVNAAMYTL